MVKHRAQRMRWVAVATVAVLCAAQGLEQAHLVLAPHTLCAEHGAIEEAVAPSAVPDVAGRSLPEIGADPVPEIGFVGGSVWSVPSIAVASQIVSIATRTGSADAISAERSIAAASEHQRCGVVALRRRITASESERIVSVAVVVDPSVGFECDGQQPSRARAVLSVAPKASPPV